MAFFDDAGALSGLPDWAKEAASASAKSKGKEGYRLTLSAPRIAAAERDIDWGRMWSA